jgi:Xaa-Pro aminopeptidase
MHEQQRNLARRTMQERQLSAALFADVATITWLTGFAPPPQPGPHPFAGGPPLLWYEDGHFSLIVVDAFADAARSFMHERDGGVVTYTGMSHLEPLQGYANLQAALAQLWKNGRGGRIGVEMEKTPATVVAALWKAHATRDLVPLDNVMAPLRAIKTDEEIGKLRRSFHLVEEGHAAARRAVMVDAREIDVWTAVQSAIERSAGRRIPMGNDCIVGTRDWNVGGWPLDRPLNDGDSIIVDLSTIREGYWSDSCATYVAGTPTVDQEAIHKVVSEALALGASMLRPGAITGEIDQALRRHITKAGFPDYPHHTGHGIGITGHEAPRFVPGGKEMLKPGMVVMLEPGIYLPGRTGVRLEDGFLITATGAEQLTTHAKGLV